MQDRRCVYHVRTKEGAILDILKELETLSDEDLEALIARAEEILHQGGETPHLPKNPPLAYGKTRRICKTAPHRCMRCASTRGETMRDTDIVVNTLRGLFVYSRYAMRV
jgi:hypothetical protein